MRSIIEPVHLAYDDSYTLLIASTETAEALDRAGLVQSVEIAPDVKADTTPNGEILSCWILSRPYDDAEVRDGGDTVTLRLFQPTAPESREDAGSVTLHRCTRTGAVAAVTILKPCR